MKRLVLALLAGCGGADVCDDGMRLGQSVTLEWTLPDDLDSVRDRFPQIMTVERMETFPPAFDRSGGWHYTLRGGNVGSEMTASLYTDTCGLTFGASLCDRGGRCETTVLGNMDWNGSAWDTPVQVRFGGPPFYAAGLVMRP